jgi:uncharacterized phage protein gp47/JayE
MGATPIAYIDAFGIHKPDFPTELTYFTSQFQSIFGADIYLGNDSQDGQFVGLLALTLDDVNNQAIEVYNSFSPVTAQGTGLASNVKINGIARKVPSFSIVPTIIGGQAGTVINNGFVTDINGIRWNLPTLVTIPSLGQITVTATCAILGAITTVAGPATIGNPSFGWQSAVFFAAATPGAPVESDAALRQRQAISTAIPSKTSLEGTISALAALPNVNRIVAYENDTAFPDANGLPGHSVAFVVDGGDTTAIATTIALKKPPGACSTYGSIITPIIDAYGIVHNIAYFPPEIINISINVTVRALVGFTFVVQSNIQASLIAWINALPIGAAILLPRIYMPAQLSGGFGSGTFELVSIAIARDGLMPVPSDILLAFDEAPFIQASFINITVM